MLLPEAAKRYEDFGDRVRFANKEPGQRLQTAESFERPGQEAGIRRHAARALRRREHASADTVRAPVKLRDRWLQKLAVEADRP